MNSQRIMARTFGANAICTLVIFVACFGCAPKPEKKPQPCYVSAKALFERASRDYHIPSAQARGPERSRLELQAAEIYRDIVQNHSAEGYWAAQAARSLGNIYAAQTNVSAAVEWYLKVGERYGQQDFQVLMAWKSAADLLWDNDRSEEAKKFYRQIVARYAAPDAAPIVAMVVRGSLARL